MKKMKSENQSHDVELTKAITIRQIFSGCSPSLAVYRNCKHPEEIIACGEYVHGCVRALEDGPWEKEWDQLSVDMKRYNNPLVNQH